MTTDDATIPKQAFVPATLPWLAAAGAMLVYLLTLNHWLTLSSLPQVARVAGWEWQPSLFGPLHFLVTYPVRWLPEPWIPVALNVFAAICGALTLALLARSVALLPYDRTQPQRQLEHHEFSLLSIRAAWAPPLLAVSACGLQMTFWENATVASSEMLDLLLFAYVIRCLLEYRIVQRHSWLMRASLIFGAGAADNWAMLGFLPVFLCALVWIKGAGFFNLRFLSRMALCGLAGMAFYLLLPLIHAFSTDPQVGFWPALRFMLGSQKNILVLLFNQFFKAHRDVALLLCLTSLLPVLVLSIRWRSSFGDTSPLGIALTTFVFHFVHAVLLFVCLWVFFDPPFGPRQSWRQLGFALPFLTFYYLSALSVGYFSGYFLLLFGGRAGNSRNDSDAFSRLLHTVIPVVIWPLLISMPTLLFLKNLPQVRSNNGNALRQHATLVAQSLPARGAVVLSDDPVRLLLLQAVLTETKAATNYVLLDTQSLLSPRYHRIMNRRHPALWNIPATTAQAADMLDSPKLLELITRVAQNRPVYYLHPSFGYYFEQFHLQPHGLAYQLEFYPTNTINAPLPTAEVLRENDDFWKKAEAEALGAVAALILRPGDAEGSGLADRLMAWARLRREPDAQALAVAPYYSHALNYWGVQLQKSGRLEDAARCFTRAKELNRDNVVAGLNLAYNANLQSGKQVPLQLSKNLEDQFGKYRNWAQVIGQNGPFDEPSFCYELGRVFAQGGLYRQAAQQFDRVKTLTPDNLAARLWLAQLYNLWQLPDRVLTAVAEVRAEPSFAHLLATNPVELVYLEASAHFARTNAGAAERILESAKIQHPGNRSLLGAAAQIYLAYHRYSNALATVEEQLRIDPNDLNALINKGYLCLQLNAFADAVPPLTHVLSVQTNNYPALFNRAVASLQSGNLDDAQADYQTLYKAFPTACQIHYGLGEIAYRKKDTNSAITYCQLYLSNSIPNSAEGKLVSARLVELRGSSR